MGAATMSAVPFIDENSEEDAIAQYENWKKNAQKEESPCATVFLLGDLGVLFWQDEGMPWIARVRVELPTRELRPDGTEYPVKASFIAFGQGGFEGVSKKTKTKIKPANEHPLYLEFVAAMEKIDVFD